MLVQNMRRMLQTAGTPKAKLRGVWPTLATARLSDSSSRVGPPQPQRQREKQRLPGLCVVMPAKCIAEFLFKKRTHTSQTVSNLHQPFHSANALPVTLHSPLVQEDNHGWPYVAVGLAAYGAATTDEKTGATRKLNYKVDAFFVRRPPEMRRDCSRAASHGQGKREGESARFQSPQLRGNQTGRTRRNTGQGRYHDKHSEAEQIPSAAIHVTAVAGSGAAVYKNDRHGDHRSRPRARPLYFSPGIQPGDGIVLLAPDPHVRCGSFLEHGRDPSSAFKTRGWRHAAEDSTGAGTRALPLR